MEHEPYKKRIRRMDQKINLLIGLAVVQLILTLFIVIQLFLPSTFTLVLMLLSLAVFLFVFRQQIPFWFGSLSRFVFGQLSSAQKSDSMKDTKQG